MLSEDIAKKIISVQPMGEAAKAFAEIYNNARSEKELLKDGYKPVSRLGLMYIKEKS